MVKKQIIKSFVGSRGMLHVFQKSPWPPEAFLQVPQLTIKNSVPRARFSCTEKSGLRTALIILSKKILPGTRPQIPLNPGN